MHANKILISCAIMVWAVAILSAGIESPAAERPNIIFIMVDDMGYHDLGCYGSRTIQTPNIDRLAAEGMRFTDCYSGDTVCAPARSTLMTGTHKGHTPVRGNSGGIPLFPEDVTVAEVLKKAGYATGGFGKWGLGNQGKDGAAERQGFDLFFGYYNQWHAHTYYTHLFRNSEKVELNGRYTHHAIFDETMQFVKDNHAKPFFLYCPWTPPHAAYQIPEDEPAWALYKDKPWDKAAQVAAAMDSMMDRQIGEMMDLLTELKIDDNTIVFFTSDNGAAKRFEGVHNSCGIMQGHKRSMHEGGIRIPMIVRWPGKIKAGVVSDFPWYFPDVMPTLAELAGVSDGVPRGIDGLSVVPTLLGSGQQQQHEYMFWHSGNGRAVRSGKWKGLVKGGEFYLYDLSQDMAEQNDLAEQHPEIAKRLKRYAEEGYREPRSQKDDGKYTGRGAQEKRRKKVLRSTFTADASKPRNIVFFLVDDLGWADVGCFGSQFHETPNIDSLCASGMKFTDGYAACPVCSPTRASIMTGRHPVRVDITDWIPGARARRNSNPRFLHVDDRDNLALEEVTIAEVLKENGYQTFFAGKWHLGDKGHWPTDQGFDFNIGGNSKGSPPGGYYSPWTNPTLQAKHKGEYVTERLTEESISFLDQRDADKPFLLYLSYYNVHTPITPYKKRHEHYVDKAQTTFQGETPRITEHRGYSRGRQDNPDYASMVAAVDDSVGAILSQIRELGLEDDTAVFFFSDNGGLCTKAAPGPTSNLPLRSGKGWLYEGGVREPTIIRVPGITDPGSVCHEPIVSMDFFPTILHLAGVASRPERHTDGVDLMPFLQGGEVKSERALYWHYPHYHGSTWTPGASIRQGDWKLIEFYEFDKVELYNLATDPGEQTNLAEKAPDKTKSLREALRGWQVSMNAKMPQPNPNYAHK